VDPQLLGARLDEVGTELSRWANALDATGPGLGALAHLADSGGTLATFAAAARALDDEAPEGALAPVRRRIARLVTSRAGDALLEPMIESAIGRREPVAADEVRAALDETVELDPATRFAVALLTEPSERAAETWLERGVSGADASVAGRLLEERIAAIEPDAQSWWRLHDALSARADSAGGAGPAFATVRSELLASLREIAGFGTFTEPPDERRPITLALGPDVIPEDPGPHWVVFSTMLPAARERVLESTGCDMPAVTVMPDRRRRDVLRLLFYGAPLCALRLPETAPGSPDALEFAIAQLEQFVRDHLGDGVSIPDVSNHASLLGVEIRERVMSDPATVMRWLGLLRASIGRGEMHEPAETARRIAAQTVPDSLGGNGAAPTTAEADVHA
jgi:hypothetical protein